MSASDDGKASDEGNGNGNGTPVPESDVLARIERVERLAASLKGADVELDVTTSDGRRHRARRLENITIDVRRDLVTGHDPVAGGVRSFRLSRVSGMVRAGDAAAAPAPEAVS